MNSPKVSVIVPIYKVEKFIAHCVESLMKQTLQEVEYIFVNDATPDSSIEVLHSTIAKFPLRKEQIIIVTHDHNQGLPAARNTGLTVASGEYIFHCDSDDFVEAEMLDQLYEAAVRQDADIVWCDWFLSFERNERYMKQPEYGSSMEAVKGMLSGTMKFNVWNKLVRRNLYRDNHISFPSGYGMGEDMTMILLFSCAEKVAYVPKAFYHYVKLNTGAFSQTHSERHLMELKHNVQRVVDYLQREYGNNLESEIAYLKLEAKFPFLIINGKVDMYKLWKEWYPEANQYITQNKNVSLRSRCLQWCAWKNQYWIVWLHYQFVCRFIYGVIYR